MSEAGWVQHLLQASRGLSMRHKIAMWGSLASVVAAVVSVLAFVAPSEVASQRASEQAPSPQTIMTQQTQGAVSTPVNIASGVVNITNQVESPLPRMEAVQQTAPNHAEPNEPDRPSSDGVQTLESPRAQPEVYINSGPGTQVNKPSAPVTVNNHYGAREVRYPEPTESEMKQAVLDAMEARGGKRTGSDAVAIENMLAGASVDLREFKKLECVPAQRAGYACDYYVTTGIHMYSTEGSAAGAAHADAVNTLMRFMSGTSSSSRTQGRFIKNGNRWELAGDG